MPELLPPRNRRERKRQETFEEIVEASGRLLREGADLSLRAVAAEMGMTPTGLYRYVDSAEALHALVAGSIIADVIADMAGVRDQYPDDDPAAQLAAVTSQFRAWALARSTEFQMVFATPTPVNPVGRSRPISIGESGIEDSSVRLSDFFAEIFIKLCALGLIKAPTAKELGEEIVDVVQRSLTDAQRPLLVALGDRGPGTIWLLKLAWTRLYGVLTMEVFGQIEPAIIESGLLFSELMRETFVSLGMADSWDRLLRVSTETTAGTQYSRVG